MAFKVIRTFLWKILTLIIAIILTPLLPLCLMLFTPIYLYRILISKIAKYVRPDLGKILTASSTHASFDDWHKPNPAWVIITPFVFQGTIDLPKIQNVLSNKTLDVTLPNGELQYQEFKQYPVSWMGFRFWKNEKNFVTESHITAYIPKPGERLSTDFLKNLNQEGLTKPFVKKRSPWDALVVNNYEVEGCSDPHTLVFVRVHHSMGDGVSFIKCFIEGVFGLEIPKDSPKAMTLIKKARGPFFYVLFPLRAIWEFSEMVVVARLKGSPLHVPVHRRTRSLFAVSNKIPIDPLQKFKTAMDVSLSSVIMSACTGGLKTMMERKGIQIPYELTCWLPVPLPGRKDKLRNHVAPVMLNLPLASASSPDERIRMLNDSYMNLVHSTGPVFNRLISVCTGALFLPLAKALSTGLIPSVLISNIPCNFTHLEFEGHKLVDLIAYSGLCNLSSISFFVFTFNGCMKMIVVAENKLLSLEETEELVKSIEEELLSNANQSLTCKNFSKFIRAGWEDNKLLLNPDYVAFETITYG